MVHFILTIYLYDVIKDSCRLLGIVICIKPKSISSYVVYAVVKPVLSFCQFVMKIFHLTLCSSESTCYIISNHNKHVPQVTV